MMSQQQLYCLEQLREGVWTGGLNDNKAVNPEMNMKFVRTTTYWSVVMGALLGTFNGSQCAVMRLRGGTKDRWNGVGGGFVTGALFGSLPNKAERVEGWTWAQLKERKLPVKLTFRPAQHIAGLTLMLSTFGYFVESLRTRRVDSFASSSDTASSNAAGAASVSSTLQRVFGGLLGHGIGVDEKAASPALASASTASQQQQQQQRALPPLSSSQLPASAHARSALALSSAPDSAAALRSPASRSEFRCLALDLPLARSLRESAAAASTAADADADEGHESEPVLVHAEADRMSLSGSGGGGAGWRPEALQRALQQAARLSMSRTALALAHVRAKRRSVTSASAAALRAPRSVPASR